jgi:hypothetical protein
MDKQLRLANPPPPRGLEGTHKNQKSSSLGAGWLSKIGKEGITNAARGTLSTAAAHWMGSQDYCPEGGASSDRDGAAGAARGASTNGMNPTDLNCHYDVDGPGTSPQKQCGTCPSEQFKR